MATVITIVSFVLVLGVLVFFHEFGHYWVARRNGIVVHEFGMGYPPRLVKLFTYDGTDFTLNLIPFGGFARMKGEDASDLSPGSFNAASRGARAATLVAGPAMNAILAVFLFAFSFMVGFPSPIATPQVNTVVAGSPAEQLGLQAGDILLLADDQPVLVSVLPFDGQETWSEQLTGELPAATSLTIIRDGALQETPLNNIALDQLIATLDYSPLDTRIMATAADSPAAQVGLQSGDIVYRVNDTIVTPQNSLRDLIQENLGQEVTLTVLRGTEWKTVQVTPRADPPEGQGALGVDLTFQTRLANLPFFSALREGVSAMVEYITVVLQVPFMLIQGTMAPADAQLQGPVGIARLVGDAATVTIDTGLFYPILSLSAILSVALAITNLLPLPALDGGRLFFILIETLRGRRINPEREGFVHMVGFMLLLGLLVYITVQDIRAVPESIPWRAILGQ